MSEPWCDAPGDKQPPAAITILFCPTCGRDDRFTPFTGRSHHYHGKKCPGAPVLVTYDLRPAHSQAIPD